MADTIANQNKKLEFLDKYIGNVNEVIEDKEDIKRLWTFFELLRKEKEAKQREDNQASRFLGYTKMRINT